MSLSDSLKLFVLFPNVSFLWFPVLIWFFLLAFEDGWPDQNWDRGYDSKFEGTRHNFGLPVTQNELTPGRKERGREERWTFPAVVGVISSRTVFIFQVSLHYFLSPFGETKKQLGTVFRIFSQVWPLIVLSWSLQALQSTLQALLPLRSFWVFWVLLNILGSCHLVLFCWKVLGYNKTETQLWLRQQPFPVHGKRHWDSVYESLSTLKMTGFHFLLHHPFLASHL